MIEFLPSTFFNVEKSALCSQLFAADQPVWHVLNKGIKNFLSKHQAFHIEGNVSAQAHVEGDVHIGKGSVVEAGAYLKGPIYIGENTQIRHGAYLRGDCIIGNDCVVGHSTEVKHSIFLDGSHAGHFNYVGDSVLGHDVNLGAGTKLANLKLTRTSVIMRSSSGERIDTGLRKFGAILGDETQTGCNSVLSPGVLCGKSCLIYPCCHVNSGVYTGKSRLK